MVLGTVTHGTAALTALTAHGLPVPSPPSPRSPLWARFPSVAPLSTAVGTGSQPGHVPQGSQQKQWWPWGAASFSEHRVTQTFLAAPCHQDGPPEAVRGTWQPELVLWGPSEEWLWGPRQAGRWGAAAGVASG